MFAWGALSRRADPARRLADELAKSFDELGLRQARRGLGPDLARRDARAALLVCLRELGNESIPDRAGSDDQDILIVGVVTCTVWVVEPPALSGRVTA